MVKISVVQIIYIYMLMYLQEYEYYNINIYISRQTDFLSRKIKGGYNSNDN